MCKDLGIGGSGQGLPPRCLQLCGLGGSPFWLPGQPLVGVYNCRLGTPPIPPSPCCWLGGEGQHLHQALGPAPPSASVTNGLFVFEPLLSCELDCGNSTWMFYSETAGIGCGKQRGFPRESGLPAGPSLSIFLLPQLFLGGTGQHILYKDKVLGQGRVEPSGLLWTCSSPVETSPREGTVRGLASEHPATWAPYPPHPIFVSPPHSAPTLPPIPPYFRFPLQLGGRWQFTHTRSFFLAPPPPLSNCSGVSPNQCFELGCENQPKSGPGSALSVQDVCEDPVGTPEARGWGYTEAFQGQLRPGSQTVLLGSLELPHGHTSAGLRRGCLKPAGKGLRAESRI